MEGAIHREAGSELLEEYLSLGGCETGGARITKSYRLPCRYVIHAVGPCWQGGRQGEREKLESCYRALLLLAREYRCETAAFPLIASGIYGYPKDQALRVAIDTIGEFLLENDMAVYLVVFDRKTYQISGKLYADIAEFIDDRYADEHSDERQERTHCLNAMHYEEKHCAAPVLEEADAAPMAIWSAPPSASREGKARSLDDVLKRIDESFSKMLLCKIDERGMTDAQ